MAAQNTDNPTTPGGKTSPPTSGSPGELDKILSALSGKDFQTVLGAVTNAIHGNPDDLTKMLSDVDARDADITKLTEQVKQRGITEQEIADRLKTLQAQGNALDAQIKTVDDQISVRSDADVKRLSGEDLLEEK